MQKFRKKPVVIEAIQFQLKNWFDIQNWSGEKAVMAQVDDKPVLQIATLEGTMTASLGDWIIKGIQGEFYPCKPDIFEQTYEEVF